MPEQDTLHRFLIEDSPVRGECIHLDETWRAMLEHNDYPPAVKKVLGEAVTALALLAATIKFEGSLSLQITGDGPLNMLVAHCSSDATLRGLARWRGQTEDLEFSELMGSAILVMTIDPGPGKERYQGIVAVDKSDLSAVLQEYFERSEQLPTRIWLASNQESVAGLLLQKIPDHEDSSGTWSRVTNSTDRVTAEQLLDLPPEHLLPQIYARENIRLFSGKPVRYGCHCSRTRAGDTVLALGPAEFAGELDRGEPVQVDCEFCNRRYEFDAIDLAMLFANQASSEPGTTQH